MALHNWNRNIIVDAELKAVDSAYKLHVDPDACAEPEHVELNEALPEIEKHEEQSQQDHTNEQQQLNKLLDLLSLEERSIVVFRMTGNLEFSEISQILDVKLSAVKMRYKRALEKMAVSAKKSHVSE